MKHTVALFGALITFAPIAGLDRLAMAQDAGCRV